MIPNNANNYELYIFDCCFAATSAVKRQETEYLAAAAMENIAIVSQSNHLTRRLTELLKRSKGQAMTVAAYHSLLILEMDTPAHRLDNTPVYVPQATHPSIILAPMGPASKGVQAALKG